MTLPTATTVKRPARPGGSPAPRRRSLLVVPWAVVGLYLLGRLVQLLFLGHPLLTPDTPMYRYAGQGWLDYPAANFLGHTLRPWPITLLYSVAPTDTARMLAQFAIATCCWAFCIWQFARLVPNRVTAAVAGGAVAVLALSVGVSGFDGLLLSESLALSLLALYLGCILSFAGGRGRAPTLAVALVAALLLGLLRPALLLLIPVVPLAAYLVWMRPRPRPRAGKGAAAAVLVLGALAVGAMGYAWTYNVQIDKTWGGWLSVPGLNGRTLTQYYLAADHTPSGPSLVEAMIHAGAPACLRPSPPIVPGDLARDYFGEDRARCPDGQAWLSDHFVSALAVHLATHPGAARRYFADALGDESVLRPDGRATVALVVPLAVTDLFYSRHRGFGGDPLILWSLVALGAVMARHRLLRGSGAGPSALQVSVAAVAVAAVAALAGTALLSASDASRVALPVTTLIRLVVIAVIARASWRVARAPGRPGPR